MDVSMKLFKGNLGKDPELAYTMKQEPVCKLSVAVNNENSNDGPMWHKVVVWGKQAELCKLYLKKGKEVFVQGRIELKKSINESGTENIYQEVLAKVVGFTNL